MMVPNNLIKKDEIFKAVYNSNNEYWVSNLGRIYSIGGKSNNNLYGKFLSFGLQGKGRLKGMGYHCTVLRKISKNTISVHRVVALHFIPNPNNLSEVNHINGNRLDNRSDNLEWVSGSENMIHAYKNNPNKVTDKVRSTARNLLRIQGISKRSLTMEDAKNIRLEYKNRFDTKILSEKYHVGTHVIRRIVQGVTYNDCRCIDATMDKDL